MRPIVALAGKIRSDAASGRVVASLSAGATAGLGLLVAQVAFATFIFSGPLAPYSSQGVGLVLFGNFAACLIMALAAGYRGVIAGLSPALVIGMAAFGSSMDAQGDTLFVTVTAALMLSALFTGACCMMLGRFRLANLLRFIPYPVSAGFVAGIGGAVCLAAMSLMGSGLHWSGIPELFEPASLWRWGPGVGYGIALYVAMKRFGKALIVPFSVVLFVGGYHLALAGLGISPAEARAAGLLLTGTADGNLWPALGFADLALVDWAAMATQVPNMLALMLVAFICVILNLAGLEVAANQDLDWDREFRVGGLASVVAGLGGGTVATIVVPASLRSRLFGAATRLTGVVAALVVGAALFAGDGILEPVPSPLVAGILVFAGLGMLEEGLFRSYRRLPLPEFGIVALIFVVIVAVGLLEGAAAGMLAILIFFAVRLSRVDVVESWFTGRERRSNRARPVPDRAILMEEGGRVRACALRGYLFFGSISSLSDRLREALAEPVPPRFLLLDFAAVSGFDYSAVNVLGRLLQEAQAAGIQVVLSALPEPLRAGLMRNLSSMAFGEFLVEPNADLALERCEELVIAAWNARAAGTEGERAALLERTAEEFEGELDRQIDFEALVEELGEWLDVRDHSAGEALARSGERNAGLRMLLSGRVSACDSAGARIRQHGPGDVVSPAGTANNQEVSMIADGPCRTLLLTQEARDRLESNRPLLALKLYRYLLSGHFQGGKEPAP